MATRSFPSLGQRKFPSLHLQTVLILNLACTLQEFTEQFCSCFPETFQTCFVYSNSPAQQLDTPENRHTTFNRHTDFSSLIGKVESAISPLVYMDVKIEGLVKLTSNQYLREFIPLFPDFSPALLLSTRAPPL